MKEDYFVKNEQICKREGEQIMLIMDIKIDNLYAFKNFHMNMSYPKKIVDSTIPEEYLHDRPNFRYKKLNIIMILFFLFHYLIFLHNSHNYLLVQLELPESVSLHSPRYNFLFHLAISSSQICKTDYILSQTQFLTWFPLLHH